MVEAQAAPPPPGTPALAALPPATDWALRPFDATSLSPAWVGLAYTFAYLGVYLVYHNVSGNLSGFVMMTRPFWIAGAFEPQPLWEVHGSWAILINAAMVGFIPMMGTYLRRGAFRDLLDMRSTLRTGPDGFDVLVAETISTSRGHLLVAGALGLAWGLALPFSDRAITGEIGADSLSGSYFTWVVVRTMLFGWMLTRLVWAEIDLTRAYAGIGRTLTQIDLLDLGGLAPFARKGLRSALLWVILTSIFSLFWLAPAPGDANLLLLCGVVALMTTSFVLPVRGVHQQIRATKRAELERVTDEIRREREHVISSRDPAEPVSARLANLIAYRSLIAEVREWPFDASTLLRFGLFVSLALGSWLGGAIVERLLDAAVG